MAIATPESYADMLDRAKAGKYAIPAINVTSSQTLSAALKGFADAESDGIVQISNGGAAYWSGSSRLDRVKGSIAFAAYARAVGDLYPVTIGLHTDHCPKKLLADWIHPLLEIEAEQVKNGELPMFNSHMWDGSAEALDDNIEIAVDMLKRAKAANVVLEIEIGAVGGGAKPPLNRGHAAGLLPDRRPTWDHDPVHVTSNSWNNRPRTTDSYRHQEAPSGHCNPGVLRRHA